MATPSLFTNTEVNPGVNTASPTPGTMGALGSQQLAVPDFSGMTDPQLSQYLSSGSFATGAAGDTSPPAGGSTSPVPTTDTSGTSTTGGGLDSFISSLLGGTSLGSLAEFGTLAGLGLSQADAARQRTNQLAGQLTGIGQPFTQAGQGILSEVTGKTPVDQTSPLSSSIGQQINTAKTLSQIGQTALSGYQTGTLDAGQEAQLQAQNTAQKQAVAQQLAAAGITDSSVLDSQYQSIDNQTNINRRTMLDAQYQVGTNALNQVQQTYSNLLNQSLSLSGFGAQLQSQAVQLQIQSDSQITAGLTQLFGQIAQGFGKAVGGGAAGGAAGGGAGGTGSAAAQISKLVSSGSNLMKQLGSYFSGGSTAALGAEASQMAGQAAGEIGSSAALAGQEAATASDISATTSELLSQQAAGQAGLGISGEAADIGSTAADVGGTAGTAADVGGTAADVGSAAGTESVSASTALGSTAGALAAFAPFVATLWAAEKYPAVQLGAGYWSNLGKNLEGGQSNPNFYPAAMEALNMPADQVPDAIKQQIWASGYAAPGTWGMTGPANPTPEMYWGTGTNRGGGAGKRY